MSSQPEQHPDGPRHGQAPAEPRPTGAVPSPPRPHLTSRQHSAAAEHLPIVPEEPDTPASARSTEPTSPYSTDSLRPSPFDSPAKPGAPAADGVRPGSGASTRDSGGSRDGRGAHSSPPHGLGLTPLPFTPDPALGQLRVTARPPSSNPLFDGDLGDGELLHCPTLRHMLEPVPSPFVHNRALGGGFVSDEDRVSLQSLLFATPTIRGVSEVEEMRRSLGRMAKPSSAMAAAGPALLNRTLSTPRSSVDTNQDAYFADVPRFALRAGPRSTIYFHPNKTKIAVVTAGALCPGLNDVIRAVVLKALDYGVRESNILGIRRGFTGFYKKHLKPIQLARQVVEDIHLEGGTILGTCESCECDVMGVVKRLDLWAVDMLIVIGGQGEISSAGVIQSMCERCHVPCAVVAIPSSIDNDMLMLDKCFGYETAVEEAQKALLAAKVEATSAYRGVGLVKLMGRHSGFIAVKAALSSGLVDMVLVPEVPFRLEAALEHLERVLEVKGHAVVCMAEGAGQERFPHCLMGQDPFECRETDAGTWFKGEIRKQLKDVDCKYIDPSYLLRSIPATSDDRVLCKLMAHGAVHAAFAGYTGVAVGQVNTHQVIVPLHLLAQAPRQMDPHGELWNRLKAAIGQPSFEDDVM